MKPTSLIPPVVALVLVGGWIGTQRRALATLDRESALLRTHLAHARAAAGSDASPQAAKTPNGKPAKDKEPIDWKKIAAQMGKMQRNKGVGDMRVMIHLHQRLQSMTKEELVAALDEIAKLDLPAGSRQELEEMLIGPLVEKDPELALTRFADRLQKRDGMSWQLSTAFSKWAEKDLGKASAWFDQQIAAGNFDSKSLDGKSQARILFEGEMIRLLVGSDLAAAEARLAKLPEEQWAAIFRGQAASRVQEKDQKAYADLMRGRMAEKQKDSAIALIATNVGPKGYPEVSAYLDRIAATPEERAASARTASRSQMIQDAHKRIITREDIDTMREWVTAQSPGTADATTGAALASAVSRNGKLKFADAAALALHYQASSGNDDVLVNFLDPQQASTPMDGAPLEQNQEESIKLAEKISDPARREEVLKKLK